MKSPSQVTRWTSVVNMYETHFEPILGQWTVDAVNAAQTKVQSMLSTYGSREETPQACDATPLTVVDVGCGLGAMTLAFAERFLASAEEKAVAPVRIVASDIWPDMLTHLEQRIESPRYERFAKQIETTVMDGQTLEPLADGSVDVLMSSFGMTIFPDQDKTWSSAHRVLKKGGVLVATAWAVESDNVRWFDALATAAHEVSTASAVADGSEPPALDLPSTKLATDSNKLPTRLEKLGFSEVIAYKTSHSSVVPSGDELMDAMLQNPGVAAYLKVLGEERFRGVMLDLIKDSYNSVFSGETVSSNEKRNLVRPVIIQNAGYVVVATK
ncbi:hypothetical protein Poli38472_013837 [Pythium oligandrum]|uniref:Methyltransferase type 11 domain-containing protein n=1 Tax=Pythium oligandrum TaxID=41045 RepID=A0A8K1C266_PYTOL|nr:hypothetical protein Poli38472_013837 [Pythium oligandrum]|eukprot:TMW55075.1 hypothetical protein Poli38472_013837 [Pythium oligandrum]